MGMGIGLMNGGVANVVGAHKPSNEALASNTTLQNDDDLFFSIGAFESWQVSFNIAAAFNTLSQSKVALTVPSGCEIHLHAVANSTGLLPVTGNVGSSGLAIDLTIAGATDAIYNLVAFVSSDATPGTVHLQWAQQASNIQPTTFLQGSTMVAQRIS